MNTALRADSESDLSRADMHQYEFGMCALRAADQPPTRRSEGSWRARHDAGRQDNNVMSQEEEPAPGFEGRNSSPPADTWPTEQHQTPEQLPKKPQFRVSLDGSFPNSPKAMEIEDRYM